MRRGIFAGIKVMCCVALLLLGTACAVGDPSPEDYFATVRYHSGVANYLLGEIGSAKTAIKLSLNRIVDRQIIMGLNDAAVRGVSVEVVVDTKQEKSLAGLSPLVSARSGNQNGEMQSNFVIIDGTAVFFSDYDTTNPNTIAISIRQRDLITTLETEFGQMHDNGAFGSRNSGGKAKQRINHQTVFPTANGQIEMYFVPQNQALTYLRARMKQARKSVEVYAKYFNNEELRIDFNDVAGSGLDNTFYCGNVALTDSMRNQFLVANPSNIIVDDDLPCNAVFVDVGMAQETLLFTTFPFVSSDMLDISDGIVLFIRGSGVRQLKASLDYQIEISPKYASSGDGTVTSTVRIAFFNMLHLGKDPKNYKELAKVVLDARFDVVGVLEVYQAESGSAWELTGDAQNPKTAGIQPLLTSDSNFSSYTNLPAGRGLQDLVLNLNHWGGDEWDYDISPAAVGWESHSTSGPNLITGVSSVRECYGFVYKTEKFKGGVQSLGFYNVAPNTWWDSTREFIRPSYGVKFTTENGVNFSLIAHHSHFGDPSKDPQREAAVIYKVYEYFRDKPESGPNIIIGGDFNLPADDPAFSTFYTTTDNITYAISPDTLTSLGTSDFSSAYDNIFYSQNKIDGGMNRVLMTGRGAYKDWVTLTDYSKYGFKSENNFTYVRQFISDHVPVYITFNTTPASPGP